MMINSALIGYSGFVGSNLVTQHHFDKLYNSKNIAQIAAQEIDLLVCAGVSAVKWLANQQPQADRENIDKLKHYLTQVKANHLVLISTIDIYDSPLGVNEDIVPDTSQQDVYGQHRYDLEQWVAQQESFKRYTIIRLPGLFGKQLKKNLIFDLINPLAKSLNHSLWQQLQTKLTSPQQKLILKHYCQDEFLNLHQKPDISAEERQQLIAAFQSGGFSPLNFTDSRSSFQFYNLNNLWNDITNYALKQQLALVNLASEPISAAELIYYLTQQEFINHTPQGGISYDMYSKYALNHKYLYSKSAILAQIQAFVEKSKL